MQHERPAVGFIMPQPPCRGCAVRPPTGRRRAAREDGGADAAERVGEACMQTRRRFLRSMGIAALAAGLPGGGAVPSAAERKPLSLFLCGDVMLGRGIDQILAHPSKPVLYEPAVHDARDYVTLAERANGRIAHPVDAAYVWGDALAELRRRHPDLRIVNLETSVTRHDTPWPGKGIQYRMHPDNANVLSAAGIDCCVLSNNHVLDWSEAGLVETLATLHRHDIATAGAGLTLAAAAAPAVLSTAGGRVLVFGAATEDSGVPEGWAATSRRAGVHRLPDLSERTLAGIAADIRAHRRDGDRVVFSVHWGGNWGFEVTAAQRGFAHGLIDEAGVDLVHGHSPHHVKGIEVHNGRLVLHGCGDFIDDYEGIGGEERFRGDLGLMYFPEIDRDDGRLLALQMVPTRIRHLRVNRAEGDDRGWLLATLQRECRKLGSDVVAREDGSLALRWTGADATASALGG
jgi:poly-gamma-glutamate synthesis protein (capsule biosynthesis protein)